MQNPLQTHEVISAVRRKLISTSEKTEDFFPKTHPSLFRTILLGFEGSVNSSDWFHRVIRLKNQGL